MNKRESSKLQDEIRRFPRTSEPVVGHHVGLGGHPQGLWLLCEGVRGNGGHDLSHVLKESFRL